MALSLEEIKNITFHKARNGYQTENVDDFIDGVIETVEALSKERDDYLKKLDILAKKVEEYRASEESVGNVLLSAQRLADSNIREATHKAEVVLKDAQTKADAIIADANAKAEKMLSDAKNNSQRAITSGSLEIERQKKVLAELNAEVQSFQKDVIEKYTKELETIKNITVLEQHIKAAEDADKNYPTPDKVISSPKKQEIEDISSNSDGKSASEISSKEDAENISADNDTSADEKQESENK